MTGHCGLYEFLIGLSVQGNRLPWQHDQIWTSRALKKQHVYNFFFARSIRECSVSTKQWCFRRSCHTNFRAKNCVKNSRAGSSQARYCPKFNMPAQLSKQLEYVEDGFSNSDKRPHVCKVIVTCSSQRPFHSLEFRTILLKVTSLAEKCLLQG